MPKQSSSPIHSKFLPSTGFVRLSAIVGPGGVFPVSKSAWWAGIKSGIYPRPVKLSTRARAPGAFQISIGSSSALRRAMTTKASLLRQIRAHCLECAGRSPSEVRKCRLQTCSLWPFRMAKDPIPARTSAAEKLNVQRTDFEKEPTSCNQWGMATAK